MTSLSSYKKAKPKTVLLIGIVLVAAIGLYSMPSLLFSILWKSDATLKNEAMSDLYTYAVKPLKNWKKSEAFYFGGKDAEAVLDKVRDSQSGYAWKVVDDDTVEWDTLLTARSTAHNTALFASQSTVEIHACVRYRASLKTKALDAFPISCLKEQMSYGDEVLLEKKKLDQYIKQTL